MNDKIIISSGNDNYHMLFTAAEIDKKNRLKFLICGPYPTRLLNFFLKNIKFLNLIKKLLNRKDNIDSKKIKSLWISEIISQLSNAIMNIYKNEFIKNKLDYLSLNIFRNKTLKLIKSDFLNDVKIFHFRSGYGGKSIQFFKEKKIITLCDHGIVHPKILDYLVKNKGKFPNKKNFKLKKKFWYLVNQDLNQSDFIIVNSNFVKKTFIHFKYPAKKIFVNYLGVEDKFIKLIPRYERKYNKKKDKIKLLFSGSLIERKGIFDLQKSLTYLNGIRYELHLAGPLSSTNKSRLSKLLANTSVTYHGVLDKKSLCKLMYNSDIFVFPSYAEGSARVIFEAMASGCAVITTKNSGSVIKNFENGIIIKPNEPKSISNSIKFFYKNKNNISKYGKKNKLLIRKKYTQKRYGGELIKIYNKIKL